MVKFFDFSKVVEAQGPELNNAFLRVLNSHRYILGDEVSSFESQFSTWSKSTWTVGCANGTDTIEIGLKVLGVQDSDEVITTPLTAMPTLMGIIPTGASIKLVDIDVETGLISSSKIKNAVTKKTKAIVPVHLYGQVCDMEDIQQTCRENNILLLEDCAQAHGATHNNKHAGSWGALSSWSFYPTKNLGAFGDAGALTGFDQELWSKVKAYRNYGQSSLYKHDFLGRNSRMDELQAALLKVRLEVLDKEIANRRRIASIYWSELKSKISIVSGSKDNETSKSSYHIFAAVSPYEREKFREKLRDNGVETLVHYPIPAHKQTAFKNLGYGPGDFPNAEYLADNIVSLPIHPYLSEQDIEQVIRAVKNSV